MASEIEAAAERWRSGMYNVGDGKLLADWAVARLAADRAEREERARPIDAEWLESRGIPAGAYVVGGVSIKRETPLTYYAQDCRIDTPRDRGGWDDLLRVLKGGA
jgi:hypothetical protein